jgi:dTDP-4-amino-4,6-dideoxygalactose transaminase
MAGPGMELIGNEEIEEVIDVLKGKHLSRYGKDDDISFKQKVYKLEKEIAKMSGVKYAVAMNSGTSALMTALSALGIGPGDEVIVPGYTFIASMSTIVYARAIPVLAEVDKTLNLDPKDVEKKITSRTKAVLAVHMLGNPARMDELKKICDDHNLLLIEDCAQAFGATYKDKGIGSIGDAGIFSFNVFKTITCGDGGMVITNYEKTYRRCFAFHDQGHSPNRKGVEVGERPFLGLDFRMTELQGAVMLAQVRKVNKMIKHLRENKALYKSMIEDIPGLEFREITDENGECGTLLVIFFPTSEIARNIAKELDSKVIADSGWHVYNNMEHLINQYTVTPEGCPFKCPFYTNNGGNQKYYKGMLPQTDDLLSRAFMISIGVSDAGLGSGFGITVLDGENEIKKSANRFRSVVKKYLT